MKAVSVFMNFVFEVQERRQDGLLTGSPLRRDSYVGIYNVEVGNSEEDFTNYMKSGIKELIERYENAS